MYIHILLSVVPGTASRAYTERRVVDGWGLLHSLLADAAEDLLGQAQGEASAAAAAAADAWTMVGGLSFGTVRDNAAGADSAIEIALVCDFL